MNEIYPIGSVLEKDDSRIVILGYQINPTDNELLYQCAEFPVGLVDSDSLFCIKVNDEYNVAHMGLESDDHKKLCDLLNKTCKAYAEFGADAIVEETMNIINQISNNK